MNNTGGHYPHMEKAWNNDDPGVGRPPKLLHEDISDSPKRSKKKLQGRAKSSKAETSPGKKEQEGVQLVPRLYITLKPF